MNLITSHDGFTLRDLVTYQQKHNLANGEANEDGERTNDSVNFGIEGDTEDQPILDLRDRQRRALLATLLGSRAATMLLAGDELGRTQGGNNNAYSQDNEVSWLDWAPAARDAALLPFVRRLIALRRAHPLLRHGRPEVTSEEPMGLLITADEADAGPDAALLLGLNRAEAPLILPLPNDGGAAWEVLLDTSEAESPAPGTPNRSTAGATSYEMGGRSVVYLSRPAVPAT